MMVFFALSALLVAGVLLLIVPPLFSKGAGAGLSRTAVSLAVHRDQLCELEADARVGALAAEQHEGAKRELEARLLDDLEDAGAAAGAPSRSAAAAVAAGLAIPLFAGLLYLAIGNPQAILPGAARMAQHPENAEGWAMLGQSYEELGRFGEASQAYAQAVARLPGDAGLLADYAHALALAQGRRLQGEPESLLARALEVDPDNLKALALAGSAAFEREDYATALAHWQRLLPLVPRDSSSALALQARISDARSLGGK